MNAVLHPVPRLKVVPEAPKFRQMTRPLRLGLLTPHNPYDKQSFSGTAHHVARALAAHADIDLRILGPHRPPRVMDRILRRTSPQMTLDLLADDGRDFMDLDAVLGLVATDLLLRAGQVTDVPLLHVTDATPGFLREVYGWDVPSTADEAEARLLQTVRPVYSSAAMATRARAEFGTHATDAAVVPFGVNFDAVPQTQAESVSLERLEILFVGNNWTRKGGALALAAFDRVRATGREAHLTLVGPVPAHLMPTLKARDDITLTGFLDKNRPRDAALLEALYARAHVFVLPTRADCTPMVVAEALAYRTPVLATDIGGIAEMVGAGAGRILPAAAGPSDWACSILEMTANQTAYEMMADAAADRIAGPLNWTRWAEDIAVLAREVVLERSGARAA